MSEVRKPLVIRSKEDPKCAICNIPELSRFDDALFFRRMQFMQFCSEANKLGYVIPQKDFDLHQSKHIFVYKEKEVPRDIPSTDILIDMIAVTRAQLQQMEDSHETDKIEYTKKAELLKSLIELQGRFEGKFKEKIEVSTDFKSMLVEQMMSTVQENGTRVTTRQSVLTTGPAEKTIDVAPIVPATRELAQAMKALEAKPVVEPAAGS